MIRMISITLTCLLMAGLAQAKSHTGGLDGYEVGVKSPDLSALKVVKQKLVTPPLVPEHSLKAPKTLA